jgi:SsrA-binding protein
MSVKTVATNKRAYHEYTITEKIEAGIVLYGTEIKSVRMGKVQLSDGWVDFSSGEAVLRDVHISPYTHGNIMNHEPTQARKLLLNRKEINRLARQVAEKGITVVPLSVYLSKRLAKVEIGVAKGKKEYDKRDATKKREADRAMARVMRARG